MTGQITETVFFDLFWSLTAKRPRILLNRIPIWTNPGTIGFTRQKLAHFVLATFGRIKPIVPGFFRIGIRFERIPGRSAKFAKKRLLNLFVILLENVQTRDKKNDKNQNAAFGRIEPIVPGFFRIWFQFERGRRKNCYCRGIVLSCHNTGFG